MIRTTLKIFATATFLTIISLAANAQTLQDGLKAMERGQYEKSKKIFSGLIKSDSKNAQNYFYLGNAYFELGQVDSAKYFYSQAQQANANEPLIYAGIGKILLEEKKNEEAKTNFEKALTLSKNKDVKVMIAVAQANLDASNKNPDYAIEILNKAKELDPKNPDIFITIGDAYLEKNEGGQAVTNYERAVELNANNPKALLHLGKLWVRSRNYTEAQKNFDKTIALDSTYAPAYRELGDMFTRANKYNEASKYYKKYISMVGNSTNERIKYASFLFLNKNYKEAITELETIRKKDTSNPALLRLIGYSYFELGENDKAMSSMEKYFRGIDQKKILGSDYDYYGRILSKAGKDSQAVVNFKKALTADTSRHDLYDQIADTYYKQKKYKDAAYYYELKLKKAAADFKAQNYFDMGKAYYNAKQYAHADSAFTKLTAAIPNSHIGYLWRARANAGLDPDSKAGLAKPFYEQFIEKAGNDMAKYKDEYVEAYSYLGYYYYVKKDKTNAKNYYTKVKELDPKNKAANQILNYYNSQKGK